MKHYSAAHLHLVRVAQMNRNVGETAKVCVVGHIKVCVVGHMMAGSCRLAVLLVGLVLNWQHFAKGTSCERDGSAGAKD
jgi:hypothetical protein